MSLSSTISNAHYIITNMQRLFFCNSSSNLRCLQCMHLHLPLGNFFNLYDQKVMIDKLEIKHGSNNNSCHSPQAKLMGHRCAVFISFATKHFSFLSTANIARVIPRRLFQQQPFLRLARGLARAAAAENDPPSTTETPVAIHIEVDCF